MTGQGRTETAGGDGRAGVAGAGQPGIRAAGKDAAAPPGSGEAPSPTGMPGPYRPAPLPGTGEGGFQSVADKYPTRVATKYDSIGSNRFISDFSEVYYFIIIHTLFSAWFN